MITRTPPRWHTVDWQKSLARAIRDPRQLLEQLALPADLLPAARAGAEDFPLLVPHSYVARMQPGNPQDPLLRQVLPLEAELQNVPGYVADPVGDLPAMARPGLLHKYHGRALVVTTGACGIHCRYCFRRHFPYQEANPMPDRWQQVREYLAADESIEELILSGGDPLSLSDQRLAGLLDAVQSIPHLKRLRLHTRYPIILPERLTADLLQLLQQAPQAVIMVIHANHANELDSGVTAALAPYRQAGISLLNQAVLLRGVNDSEAALSGLSEALFEAGVLPYYLHQLDPVQGAAHFAVPDTRARGLHTALRARLPGYLVPRLVREMPGETAKSPLI
ncbi:EF-P beta-lysylation protein EpmB [Thiohalophilus thiocyanatoxydans]|uniref:L-lysine 2,3-aminomutase n=1 Tax=Thiohalophilus thiocyanatoxydans TaxID=381308 RepID=A0A4R8IL98_9GAMM|nr:EF-P beta-lysylation protein EpmB [Thiohalophilus thiocyanatoxydans]TDY01556.1 L-lysine 2,3-aminomutase [Thiohalophilus thiocyanatoxydans]